MKVVAIPNDMHKPSAITASCKVLWVMQLQVLVTLISV